MATVFRVRYGETKDQIAKDTGVANPGASVTDSSMAFWIGDNIPSYRVNEILSALTECSDRLIEDGMPVPTLGYYGAYLPSLDVAKANIVSLDTAGTEFTNDNLGVLYGPNFPENATGSSRTTLLSGSLELLKSAYLEDAKLAA